jgi:perosamine synthetase
MTTQKAQLAIHGGSPAVTMTYEGRWPDITDLEIKAVESYLRERGLSDYAVLEEFERAFADYHGISRALATNNGTSALHCALFAAGVGPGDEVIVPTYTWLASATPIVACGAVPVFCDIDPRTLTMDPEDVARRITPRTRAIMAVHLWGHPVDMDAVLQLAQSRGIVVIEDCSHAHGSTYKGQLVGTIGDVGCFSLQASKAMVGGEGGVLITDEEDLWRRAVCLYDHARIGTLPDAVLFSYGGTGLGFKYRMHQLAAVLGKVQLTRLDGIIASRMENLNALSEGLRSVPGIDPPHTAPETTRGGWYGYVCQHRPGEIGDVSRERYVEILQAEGVEIHPQRYPLLHQQPFFIERDAHGLGYPYRGFPGERPVRGRVPELPQAGAVHPNLLSLPTFVEPCKPLLDQYVAAFAKVAQALMSG